MRSTLGFSATENFEFKLRSGKISCLVFVPEKFSGVVLITNGRFNEKDVNRRDAIEAFTDNGWAPAFPNLLTPREASEHHFRMDSELQTSRLIMLVRHLRSLPKFYDKPLGLFGSGWGAMIAWKTALRMPGELHGLAFSDPPEYFQPNDLREISIPCLVISDRLPDLNSNHSPIPVQWHVSSRKHRKGLCNAVKMASDWISRSYRVRDHHRGRLNTEVLLQHT